MEILWHSQIDLPRWCLFVILSIGVLQTETATTQTADYQSRLPKPGVGPFTWSVHYGNAIDEVLITPELIRVRTFANDKLIGFATQHRTDEGFLPGEVVFEDGAWAVIVHTEDGGLNDTVHGVGNVIYHFPNRGAAEDFKQQLTPDPPPQPQNTSQGADEGTVGVQNNSSSKPVVYNQAPLHVIRFPGKPPSQPESSRLFESLQSLAEEPALNSTVGTPGSGAAQIDSDPIKTSASFDTELFGSAKEAGKDTVTILGKQLIDQTVNGESV
ncbi:MAG TPA: hypothetical protein VE843_08380, partial [Ktedonobacteraceae bacterium]|nr:hypothetical protein [Ktedonobacteraceae bacterium]